MVHILEKEKELQEESITVKSCWNMNLKTDKGDVKDIPKWKKIVVFKKNVHSETREALKDKKKTR